VTWRFQKSKQWQGCLKMKLKKVFYLLLLSLFLTLTACGDSPPYENEAGVLDAGDPELFQKRYEKKPNKELKK
jgi:hypothetical protein